MAQSIGQIADGRWLEIAAICLLPWLILLPHFGLRLIGETPGEGELRRLLWQALMLGVGGVTRHLLERTTVPVLFLRWAVVAPPWVGERRADLFCAGRGPP
jgi:hypothetical protein